MTDRAPGMPKWIADHIELYLTDPAKAHMWDSSLGGGDGRKLATLLLTTTGRKSGEPRHLPLIYKKVGSGFVVIASKGGAPDHPSWFKNLEADPDCVIRVSTDRHDTRVRVAIGDERSKLWAEMVALYPPYARYQEKAAPRQIPVVVLEPRAG